MKTDFLWDWTADEIRQRCRNDQLYSAVVVIASIVCALGLIVIAVLTGGLK